MIPAKLIVIGYFILSYAGLPGYFIVEGMLKKGKIEEKERFSSTNQTKKIIKPR